MMISFMNCSGGECAAVNTVFEDFDSDCVADSNDNCVLAEDPAAGYNPEQFDGDDDGVGVPCDGNDQDPNSTGVFLAKDLPFNIAGSYLITEQNCFWPSEVSIQQNNVSVQISDLNPNLNGEVILNSDEQIAYTNFHSKQSDCFGIFDIINKTFSLHCHNKNNDDFCQAIGTKQSTKLWSLDDLSTANQNTFQSGTYHLKQSTCSQSPEEITMSDQEKDLSNAKSFFYTQESEKKCLYDFHKNVLYQFCIMNEEEKSCFSHYEKE